ncbi:hypothetical protein ASG81_23210 [Paenibacillus sp. Soil522]|nr:hypothetical protein ASG81_23210 [Paenibacillus sp. Soil522]
MHYYKSGAIVITEGADKGLKTSQQHFIMNLLSKNLVVQNSEHPPLSSSDKLIQFEKEALNATLIIILDKKEVARFNLNEFKE